MPFATKQARAAGVFASGLKVIALAAISCVCVTHQAAAQSAPEALPLFLDAEPLTLTIEAPFRQISRKSRQRPEYDGTLQYRDAGGQTVELGVELRIRGNSRLRECDFPPLRLDFDRSELEGTVFAGQNRLKLVTLCKREERYRDYLQLEYQIYRIFNLLTDYSFRVRWARIEYVVTDSRRDEPFTEPAFLIEEDWEVAARHGTDLQEVESLKIGDLDRRHTAMLALFHYMIGNTDWSGVQGPAGEVCCHNGKVIGNDGSPAIVLPYDFDQSGLIDAEYAGPSEILPIRSVRERLYRGYCPMNSEIDWALARFNARREAIEQTLALSSASDAARDKALAFLRDSYAIVNDPARLQSEILDGCRG
jgi:hypothetical protein